MTDTHRHEWGFIEDGPDCDECKYRATIAIAVCECGAMMGPSQMERKLDAVECWSAEDAQYLISILHPIDWERQPILKALKAYAKALEGDDA